MKRIFSEYIHEALELRQWKTRKWVNKYMDEILLRVHGTCRKGCLVKSMP